MQGYRAILAVCWAVLMVDGFDMQLVGFVAPEIARDWQVNISAFGVVLSAALGGSIVGAMLAGPLVQTVGVRIGLIVSLGVFGGLTLAVPWAHSLPVLASLRLIAGIGLGAAVPIVVIAVASTCPPRWRATIVIATLCGQPVGAGVGAALCTHLIPLHGWASAFWLGGLLPLALIGAVWLVIPDSIGRDGSAAGSRVSGAQFNELLAADMRSVTVLSWMSIFFVGLAVYSVINWLPSVLRSSGHSLEVSLAAMSLFNGGGIVGALVQAALSDRFGPNRVLMTTIAAGALCVALLAAASATVVPALMLSALAGLTLYAGLGIFAPLALSLYPTPLHTTGVGTLMGMGRVGAVCGASAIGFMLSAGIAMGNVLYFPAMGALLATGALLGLRLNAKRQAHRSRASGVSM